MRSKLALLVLSALAVVSAQNFTINPNEVDIGERSSWCNGESNVCDTLCDNKAQDNDCDVNTLEYTCNCQNGSAPTLLPQFSSSLPAYICRQAFSDCNDANVGNATAQEDCKTDILAKCGTLEIANYTSGATTTSAAATTSATGGASGTGSAASSGASAAATSSSTAAAAPTNIHLIGNGAAVAAVGLFAYLL